MSKSMKRPYILALVLSFCAFPALHGTPPTQAPLTNPDKLKDGDLLFIESSSQRAADIKDLTYSTLTHCGIFIGGLVYEGAGRQTSYFNLKEWVKKESGSGSPHPVYVKRLKDRSALTPDAMLEFKAAAKKLHETRYDFGFAWKNKDPDSSAKECIYCSELLWRVYHDVLKVDLGTPHALKDYYLAAPTEKRREEIKAKFNELLNSPPSRNLRSGQAYDPAELAISPVEVFDSDKLEAVTDETP